MRSFLTSTLVAGLRSRSFQTIVLLGFLLVGGAYLASLFSPRQPQTVALDVGYSGLRFTLVLLALFWVQELCGYEILQRTVILILAYPVARSHYLYGRFLGIAGLLGLATLMIAILLWLVVMVSGGEYNAARPVALGAAYWVTIFGIYLDVLVVTAFALLITTLSTVAILPLALGVIFAIAARSLGVVIDFVVVRQGDGDQALVDQFGPTIKFLRWVLPDLSRLDWRDWPLYQLPPNTEALIWSVVMACSFIAILLTLAAFIFNRREFA